MTTTVSLADALRRAYANRDAAALLDLYADDATLEIIDATHPPSQPLSLAGETALRARFDDLFARDMTHAVDIVAVSDSALGYSLRCTYADGTQVACAATAALRDGQIVREVGVQAWDA